MRGGTRDASGSGEGGPSRVLHVVESGDTSGLFRGFARYASRDRWSPSFVTLQEPTPDFVDELERLDVGVFGLGVTRRRDLLAAAGRLARRLVLSRPPVVHAHLFRPSLVAMAAAWLARTPARIVTRHHSDYHTRTGRWLPITLDRWTTLTAHRVVAVSEHVRRSMMEEEQADPSRVVTIPNGVDPQRFGTPDPASVEELRRELARPDQLVVVILARLHPEKGHLHLFRAVDRLIESGLDVRLWVAGEGPFRTRYEKRVAELGLESRVDFLGFRRDAADLMMAADVVAIPSEAEAFGLVVLEARVLGRPVVATRVGAIPELLEGGKAGVLVPPGDADALAEGLAAVLRRPELRARMEAAGGGHLLDEWSLEGMVRRYEELYEEILGWRAQT